MRLIFLVPIYFCFKEIQISEKFLSNLFIIGGIFTISFYLYQSYNLSIGERYSGSSTTAITYANLLMTLIIFLLSSYLRNNSYSKKALIFSIIIMLFYVCFQTGSKGAIIGLIFSLFIFLIIYKQKILSLILPIIFSLPLVFVSPLADKFGTMYHSLLNIDINNIANSTVENASENERIYYYKFSIQKITNNPLLGIGPNNFESMLKNDLKKNNLNIRAADHAHNDFLDLFVKFGFVALVVFLYILYYFAKPALLYKKLWFSELALLNIFSQLGYMMTQSQFAHQQSIVFFTVLLYIFHSQIKKTNPS
jgi:O-antigen ligase